MVKPEDRATYRETREQRRRTYRDGARCCLDAAPIGELSIFECFAFFFLSTGALRRHTDNSGFEIKRAREHLAGALPIDTGGTNFRRP